MQKFNLILSSDIQKSASGSVVDMGVALAIFRFACHGKKIIL